MIFQPESAQKILIRVWLKIENHDPVEKKNRIVIDPEQFFDRDRDRDRFFSTRL
jgi:hypothetical protein